MKEVTMGNARRAFTSTLLELAKKDKDVIALVSDSRGSVTLVDYAKELPEQIVEIGIAEQNEVGVAAGLALAGKKPFVCAPACFLSARSLEQVKVDVAYSGLNVKIVGVSGGISYGALGYSHHSTHDIAVMRAITGLEVYLPADAAQTRKLFKAIKDRPNPAYIRLGRGDVADVYTDDSPFELGKANKRLDGKDLTIVATGEMVYPSLAAAELLMKEGISATVLDIHSIKPLDTQAILDSIKETGCVVTVEEHNVHGGLGGAVAELTAQNLPTPQLLLGLPDELLVAGESPEVKAHYELDAVGIAKRISSWYPTVRK